MLIKRPLSIAIALGGLSFASPAFASGALMCDGKGAEAVVNLSTMSVVQVLGAYARIGDDAFSTGPERGEGTPIVVGQAFGEGDAMMIDFADPNYENILVGLRLTFERGEEIWLGKLNAGDASIDVTCTTCTFG